jgi:hypothetical protein
MKDELLLNQGELISFCRDFQIDLPKSKILLAYQKVSQDKRPLTV